MAQPTSPPALHTDALWTSVFGELRRLASRYLARERMNHTLQPTAVVNEVYLRLRSSAAAEGSDRRQFCLVAARAMRQVLVDHARRRLRNKRRGTLVDLPIDEVLAPRSLDAAALLDVDAALAQLEQISPRRAEVVRLRFFAGLAEDEVADVLRVSRRTVQYEFRSARAWLSSVLDDGTGPA